jgi:hypothetical protein
MKMNIEHWLNDKRCSYQKDKRAKHGNLPKINDLSAVRIIAKKITFTSFLRVKFQKEVGGYLWSTS